MPNGGEKYSITDFAKVIKQKYPQYQDVEDTVLVQRIVDKYPQYSDKVDLGDSKKKEPTTSSQEPTGETSGEPSALKPEFSGVSTIQTLTQKQPTETTFGTIPANIDEIQQQQELVNDKNSKIRVDKANSAIGWNTGGYHELTPEQREQEIQNISEGVVQPLTGSPLRPQEQLQVLQDWKKRSETMIQQQDLESFNQSQEFLPQEYQGVQGKPLDYNEYNVQYVLNSQIMSPTQVEAYNLYDQADKETDKTKKAQLYAQAQQLIGTSALFDPATGQFTTSDTPEVQQYQSDVNDLVEVYRQTPQDKLQDLFNRKVATYKKMEADYMQAFTTLRKQQTTGATAPLPPGVETPQGTGQTTIDPTLQTYKDNLLEAQKDLEAISRIYLLREDPTQYDTGFLDNFTAAIKESLPESQFLSGFAGLLDRNLNEVQMQDMFTAFAQQEQIPLTDQQKEDLERTFTEKLGQAIGTSVPLMADIAIGYGILKGAGSATGATNMINRLYAVIGNKYGKNAASVARIIGNIADDTIVFGGVGAGGWTGFGEGTGQAIGEAVWKRLGGKYGRIGNYLAGFAGGSSTEFLAEYVGEFSDLVLSSGMPIDEATREVLGGEDWLEKAALTITMTSMFSSVANLNTLINVDKALDEQTDLTPEQKQAHQQLKDTIDKLEQQVEQRTQQPAPTEQPTQQPTPEVVETETLTAEQQPIAQQKEGEPDAIQEQTTTEGVLRDQGIRGEGELPQVEQQDQPEITTQEEVETQEQVEQPQEEIEIGGSIVMRQTPEGTQIINKKTGKVADANTRKKYARQIIAKNPKQWLKRNVDKDNFTNAKDYAEVVLSDPNATAADLLDAYADAKTIAGLTETFGASKEEIVRDLLGTHGITEEDFARIGDRNILDNSRRKSFIKKDASPIDTQLNTDEFSLITEEDVVDFIRSYKSISDFNSQNKTPDISRDIADKFRKLTGLPISESTLETYLGYANEVEEGIVNEIIYGNTLTEAEVEQRFEESRRAQKIELEKREAIAPDAQQETKAEPTAGQEVDTTQATNQATVQAQLDQMIDAPIEQVVEKIEASGLDQKQRDELLIEHFEARKQASIETSSKAISKASDDIQSLLDGFKIDTKGKAGSYILPPQVYNAAIDAIKAAVDGGATVAEAINKGFIELSNSKEYKALKTELDRRRAEAEFADILKPKQETKPNKRTSKSKIGKRLLEDESLSDEVKQNLNEDLLNYVTKSMPQTEAEAKAIIAKFGVDQAVSLAMNKQVDLPPDTRVTILMAAQKHYNSIKQYDKSEAVSNEIVRLGTAYGRGVNSFKGYEKDSVEDLQRMASKLNDEALQLLLEQNKGLFEAIQNSYNKAKKSAAKTASKLDESQTNEIKAMGMSKSQIDNKLKDAKSKFKEALQKAKETRQQAGIDSIEQTKASALADREVVDALLEVGRLLIAKGIVDFKKWVKSIRKELDLSEDDISNEQLRQLFENEPLSDSGITLREISEKNQIEQLIEDYLNSSEEPTVDGLSQVLQDIGFPKTISNKIAKSIQKKFEQIIVKDLVKLYKSESGALATFLNPKKRKRVDDIIKSNTLRGFKELEKALTKYIEESSANKPLNVDRLVELNEKRAKAPDGFMRDEITREMLYEVFKTQRTNWLDLGVSLMYSGMLSGPTTQMKNVVYNFMNAAGNYMATTLYQSINKKNPGFAWRGYIALMRGYGKGMNEAIGVFLGGSKRQEFKFEADQQILEMTEFMGGRLNPFNYFKYVPRFLAAMDTFAAEGLYELEMQSLAEMEVRKNNPNLKPGSSEFKKAVNNILYNSSNAYESALNQANQDAQLFWETVYGGQPKGTKQKTKFKSYVKRRANEIIDQSRPTELSNYAYDSAAEGTYNFEPRGYIGYFANAAIDLKRKDPTRLTNLVLPFVRTIANVTNEALNYFPPIGFYRASGLDAKHVSNPTIRQESYERGKVFWKAMMGTFSMTMLTAMAASALSDDEEDPWFSITAGGPKDWERKKQWFAQGNTEYSIKVFGISYSYQGSPLVAPLSFVGAYFDSIRYGKLEPDEAADRLALGWRNVMPFASEGTRGLVTSTVDFSFIDGVGGLFDAIDDVKSGRGDFDPITQALMAGVVDPAKNILVPNIYRQAADIFDPTIYDANDIKEEIIRGVPVLEGVYLKPKLNAFGEPVIKKGIPFVNSFAVGENSDRVWRFVAEKGLRIPGYGKPTNEGQPFTDEQFYEYVERSGKSLKSKINANLPKLRNMPKAEIQKTIEGYADEVREQVKGDIIEGKKSSSVMRF